LQSADSSPPDNDAGETENEAEAAEHGDEARAKRRTGGEPEKSNRCSALKSHP